MSSSHVLWRNQNLGTFSIQAALFGASSFGMGLGVPQIGGIANNILKLSGVDTDTSLYATSPPWQLNPNANPANLFNVLNDFRARLGNNQYAPSLLNRLDGFSAATRRSFKAGAYAALSLSPNAGGAYSVFNLNSVGALGYGIGDHGNINIPRKDFTAQSFVATDWSFITKDWAPTKNPLSMATAFRGDRVSVIDFGKRSLKSIYKWYPRKMFGLDPGEFGMTRDFIKFFLTGPSLSPDKKNSDDVDDVIVFRATIGSLSDTHSPSWTPVTMIGRADPNYQYGGYSREISLDFTIYASDRDELKPIYRKLNALAGYTTPDYGLDPTAPKTININGKTYKNTTTIGYKAPWMRITIGDLFYQQPVAINSLSYTLYDTETPWETNQLDDPQMMQVPLKIGVSLGLHMITDWLPQKGGQFYSLSQRFDKYGSHPGNDNWLSDTVTARISDAERYKSLNDVDEKTKRAETETEKFGQTPKNETSEKTVEKGFNREARRLNRRN